MGQKDTKPAIRSWCRNTSTRKFKFFFQRTINGNEISLPWCLVITALKCDALAPARTIRLRDKCKQTGQSTIAHGPSDALRTDKRSRKKHRALMAQRQLKFGTACIQGIKDLTENCTTKIILITIKRPINSVSHITACWMSNKNPAITDGTKTQKAAGRGFET